MLRRSYCNRAVRSAHSQRSVSALPSLAIVTMCMGQGPNSASQSKTQSKTLTNLLTPLPVTLKAEVDTCPPASFFAVVKVTRAYPGRGLSQASAQPLEVRLRRDKCSSSADDESELQNVCLREARLAFVVNAV